MLETHKLAKWVVRSSLEQQSAAPVAWREWVFI
jgi:hypothetical protein